MSNLGFITGLFLAFVSSGHAEDIYIPPDLADWKEWVLHDVTDLDCPLSADQRLCLWPGQLNLVVNANDGSFKQTVDVLAERWFNLPGNKEHWPQRVLANKKAMVVIERNGQPMLWLEPGRYELEGTFAWATSPTSLPIGQGTGLLSLTVAGQRIERPRWYNNTVWIAQTGKAEETTTENSMRVSVYRLIQDGAPAYVTLQLQIDVAGESREEVIGRLLPEGFEPASMRAPLPSRLDDEGNLKIQARPGSWVFQFRARSSAPLTELTFNPSGAHWPQEEIWSYAADPSIRVTEASASQPVDPQQVGIPAAWHRYPAFRFEPGEQLIIKERQRGPALNERNRLSLTRELWLDFDRGGFTARDYLSGQIKHGWRLDMEAPYELKSAKLINNQQGDGTLLVTKNPENDNATGVEVRTPQPQLQTISRLAGFSSQLPISGWQTPLESVSTVLHLPPGFRLLAVSNADRDSSTWLSRWSLLDFFLMLMVTAAVWRLYSPLLAVVTLVMLVLTIQEYAAPLWSWLNLMIALALAAALPKGRLRYSAHLYKWASVAFIALIILPFAATQLRLSIFPQLEQTTASYGSDLNRDYGLAQKANYEMDEQAVMVEPSRRSLPAPKLLESLDDVATVASSIGAQIPEKAFNRYDKDARLQAGPGIPSWSWRSNRIEWSGPIEANQTTRLWIASSWMMRLWRVAAVTLMVLVLLFLLRAKKTKLTAKFKQATPAVMSALIMIFPLLLISTSTLQAQTPDARLLEELKTRLVKQPECVPQCAVLTRAEVRFSQQQLTMNLLAHAQAHTTLMVPGQTGAWRPLQAQLNGQPTELLQIDNSGRYHIKLKPGVHRIQLSGRLPNSNSVVVTYPLVPKFIEVAGDGWEVTGVADNKLSGGALTLLRQSTASERTTLDAIDVEQFPAFVSVTRQLVFDLDWRVTTFVNRQTPQTAAINLSVPLLPGESVTREQIKVIDGAVQVNLAAGENQFSWTSTLERKPTMLLSAARDVPWQEHWIIQAGASWRLQHSGVPELNVDRNRQAVWVAQFMPWPGEELELNVARPQAVDGTTLAIDNVQLTQSVGARMTNVGLNVSYRATRGGQHDITLPGNAELSDVSVDGKPYNAVLEDAKLRLPIVPGAHAIQVNWREPTGTALKHRSSEVNLNMPASNINTRISLPSNRWVLWTVGPQLGPAVLYWTELLVLALLAFGLAKIVNAPLKMRHWLLLGLGFSTFFWPAFALVALTFLALAWRNTAKLDGRALFNTTQVLLIVLVVISMIALLIAIPAGLLGSPDMHVVGNQSSTFFLNWFADQSAAILPSAAVFSLPLWVYKAFILLWSIWIAFALIKWVPWMWQAMNQGGFWRSAVKTAAQQDE